MVRELKDFKGRAKMIKQNTTERALCTHISPCLNIKLANRELSENYCYDNLFDAVSQ